MDSLFIALNVLSLVSVLAFGFVVYQMFRMLYLYLDVMLDGSECRPLLLRLPSRVVSLLLALCFVALVL